MEPKNTDGRLFIVEGCNYSGKSTLFRALREAMPGSTVVEFHDYYHRQLAMEELKRGRDFDTRNINRGKVNPETSIAVADYNLRRIERAVSQVEEECLDRFLFERLHGTDWVYRSMLFDDDDFDVYRTVERRLNDVGAKLVVLTVTDGTMRFRMSNTTKKARHDVFSPRASYAVEFKSEPREPFIPYHLMNFDLLRRVRDGYNEFYELSEINDKRLVVSSSAVNFEKLVEEITGN